MKVPAIDYEAKLEELFGHIRAQHRYEPQDWLGWGWDRETPRKRFLSYRESHTREHMNPLDYFGKGEWKVLRHRVGSRSIDTSKASVIPMLNDEGRHG